MRHIIFQKKAQMQSEIVRVFIVAIVVILAFYVGFRSINAVFEKKCQSELIVLEKDLIASADAISSHAGTVEEKRYSMPCKIEKVYFIDLSQPIAEEVANESAEINDSYAAGVKKNVFFMKDGEVKYSIYMDDLSLRAPSYRCFETKGRERMDFLLEGYGGGANIAHRDDSLGNAGCSE